ncbi:MAG: RNA polymerase sigma-70 factor [Balneolaceae bacterium]|nr:MAG: RNA polymerase sigma-70 factor [Balneolaceae bacterium]
MLQNDNQILLAKLRSGSDDAFELIYHQYHKRLYSLAFKYLKSKELSEDAVHDVFVKLWDNRQSVNSDIKNYLFSSVRNHVLNMIRNNKRKILKQIQFEQQKIKPVNRTEEVILYSEYRKILMRGLSELPQGKRDIFQMKSEKEMTNSEIAQKMGITVNTVKSQYYHASKFIKEYLSEHADIPHQKAAKS